MTHCAATHSTDCHALPTSQCAIRDPRCQQPLQVAHRLNRSRARTERLYGGESLSPSSSLPPADHRDRSTHQVLDYAAVLGEVGRILHPGGLFISCEWGRYPSFHPALGLDPVEHAPGACHFFDTLTRALDVCRGIQPIAGTIPALLEGSGIFRDINQLCYYMPIGPWHADPQMKVLGRAFRASLVRYADSVKPLLAEAGLSGEQVSAIVGDYVHDLKT
ncbi:hypothetical protein C0991_008575, partial [Blastosporella zonata]